jgi:Ca2+-binding EF-hand superfamily protein
MNKKKALSRSNLTAAFNRFDQDCSGTITLDELRTILGNYGKKELWDQILSEVDQDGNGEIDLLEFQKMMLSKI